MEAFIEKYVNPFTDFGFKKLFGEELNKDLLLDFLNELLKEEQGQITHLTYLKTEQLGSTETDRRAISTFIARTRGERNSSSNCKRPSRTFLRFSHCTIPLFPFANKQKAAIGILS